MWALYNRAPQAPPPALRAACSEFFPFAAVRSQAAVGFSGLGRCAVVGSSAALLRTTAGADIDTHECALCSDL